MTHKNETVDTTNSVSYAIVDKQIEQYKQQLSNKKAKPDENANKIATLDASSSASQSDENHVSKEHSATDHQYIGKARGLNGDVVARVTLNVEKIEIIDEQETTGIGDLATRALPERMMEQQTLEVDGITGATVTSEAVKQAVQDAMQSAVDEWSGGPQPVPEATGLSTSSANVYEGEAQGLGGPIQVRVQSSDGQTIEAVEIVSHTETPGIGTKAIDALPAQFVEQNSTQVDVISGATVTSDALMEAVDQAMTQAKTTGGGAETPSVSLNEQDIQSAVDQLMTSRAFQGAIYDAFNQLLTSSSASGDHDATSGASES